MFKATGGPFTYCFFFSLVSLWIWLKCISKLGYCFWHTLNIGKLAIAFLPHWKSMHAKYIFYEELTACFVELLHLAYFILAILLNWCSVATNKKYISLMQMQCAIFWYFNIFVYVSCKQTRPAHTGFAWAANTYEPGSKCIHLHNAVIRLTSTLLPVGWSVFYNFFPELEL